MLTALSPFGAAVAGNPQAVAVTPDNKNVYATRFTGNLAHQFAAADNVFVSLTGQAATFAQGTASPSTSFQPFLTGNASTFAQGTPNVNITLALTGAPVATFGTGILIPVQGVLVPNLFGLTPANANIAIVGANMALGNVTLAPSFDVLAGTVLSQSLVSGALVPKGTKLSYVIAISPLGKDKPLSDTVRATVISQYANSPSILQLVDLFAQYADPSANFTNFYNNIWNIQSAKGFGLDIWGRIVGVGRQLNTPGTGNTFGFHNSVSPGDFLPFNPNAAPFSVGFQATAVVTLADDAYRTVILTKALANICDCTIPAINALLSILFAGRGKSYVINTGGMACTYRFEFVLTPLEFAILTQSGAIPQPAGVTVTNTGN